MNEETKQLSGMDQYLRTKESVNMSEEDEYLKQNKSDEELRELGWKQCTSCKEMRPQKLFYKSKRRGGMSYTCRTCHRKIVRGYRNVPDSYNYFYRRLEKMRTKARKRGLQFDLTVDDYKSLKESERCYYCEAEVDIMTIDRKDNAIGYTMSNVVPSCWYCNRLKGDTFDEYEMKIIGKAIRHKHERDKKKNEAYTKGESISDVIM